MEFMEFGAEPPPKCELVRPDGSRWEVVDYQRRDGTIFVDAVPAEASRFGVPDVEGHGAPADEPPAPGGELDAGGRGLTDSRDPSGDGLPRLENEPLGRGDVVQWRHEDGSLAWRMRIPVDGAG